MTITILLCTPNLTKKRLLLLLRPAGRPMFYAVGLRILLGILLETTIHFWCTYPLTKAVFLDIDADTLLSFKLRTLNLLGAVFIVAIAVVIAARPEIRFLSTLFSRLFVLL